MQVRIRLETEAARRRSPAVQAWIRADQSLRVGSSNTDFVVRGDPDVAPFHFEIACEGGRARVIHRAQGAVTLLNGKAVQESVLRHGDQIRAGNTLFSIELSDVPAGREAAPEAEPEAVVAAEPTPLAQLRPRKRRFRIWNQTPFKVGFLPGRVHYPGHSLTLIVKGTFRLEAGAGAVALKKQPGPCGDVPYEDDADGHGAPRYSSDMVFFKPQADLLLAGHCHPPGEQPVRQCPVTFQVGQHTRRLMVFGKRYWQGVLAKEPSLPRMFDSLPLRYEHAFGGETEGRNPSGKGAIRIEDTTGNLRIPVPEIEDAAALMPKPTAKPEPAGFGPLKWNWLPRRPWLGTYDEGWLKARWPWFPEDLDWRHFNAAPAALQVKGYLRGDESLYLQNLLPDEPEFHGRLPGLAVRSFLADNAGGFTETPMRLDTLWVDADEGRLTLVWRGVARVNSADFRELEHWYLLADPVGQPTSDPQAGFEALRDARRPQAKPAQQQTSQPDALANAEAELKQAQADLAVALAEVRKQLAAAGLDPNQPGNIEPGTRAALAALFGQPSEDEEPADPWTRARVAEHAAAGGKFAGETLPGLDLSGLDLSKADFSDATFAGVNFAGATLTAASFKGATLFDANFSRAALEKANFTDAKAPQASFVKAQLTGATLTGATLVGASFQQAVLQGARLNKVRAAGADFTKVQAAKVSFSEAQLEKCRFDQAELTKADFTKATLHDAALPHATLTQAKFEKAQLVGVQAPSVAAGKAKFTAANLTRAVFSGADLTKASLMSANVTGAIFRESKLAGAGLQKAHGSDCDFSHSDLTGVRAADSSLPTAKVARCQANKSIWSRAVLDGADFTWTDARGAEFSSSSCAQAVFLAADLFQARFRQANLAGANLRDANLFEAALAKADLTRADVSGANLFGAGLMEAVLKELTHDEQTNIQATLLATLYA